MPTYKIQTTITGDGKIILPANLKNLYNHKVELLLMDKGDIKEKTEFGIYNLDGRLDNVNIRDFAHED
ncbi:MAG TPA: hypothetical protein P5120_18070 [Spirochaetota bacterium]|nr:hypothetical protein [Spirochaetota bacterium]